MPTRTTTITAQSKIGWALPGCDEPQHEGTIESIESPPGEAVQWFCKDAKHKWRKIVGTYQITTRTALPGLHEYCRTAFGIHDDICSFLIDFAIAVEYEVQKSGPKALHGEAKSQRKIRLTATAHQALLDARLGFSESVEQVGRCLANGGKVLLVEESSEKEL